MSRSGLAFAIVALLAGTPAVASSQDPATPLIGRWKTERQGGVVEIHRCGEALCGRVVDGAPLRTNPDQRDVRNGNAALRSRKVMGLRVLENLTGGPTEWKGGPVYDPDSGDRGTSSRITLVSRDVIKLKGCVGPICRTQTWTRAK
ncbi:DUF2147 domain-containing protein [Caulobacter mirabilis]|uniref:DUF2147 domain-containing protein n=1 Tax=Caulobacter mirabilis TaxID=69666 RepID=A0A2D2B1R5_9CAUL|nr:DUF2147 domain-containing protein [Caulobacter mirabilis]ATQ44158.1 hypothetical protein CSW64_18080 [Caulobacter mirabilis]